MCEVCAIFGAGEHWSDFGRERDERFPFEDIMHYRTERARRLALLTRILSPNGIRVEDWDGEACEVIGASGRSRIAPTLGDVWRLAEDLSGRSVDPLSDAFLSEGASHA